ncbi:uncharacterized protein EI90DRAFT_3143709 [Cantharellus anzutake]|uniref:uncharacterized protein n=1 Tax=Cantharellus anzutake TaxID=1750568 RepID=UPI0019082297|nr:uncharacterized protein EI90DRAFT_3143709 [Cantharellus anzutake]KAF8341366.1 hypothetical protein EI90DRAFT_3143709 [Cantharellus anzutake]
MPALILSAWVLLRQGPTGLGLTSAAYRILKFLAFLHAAIVGVLIFIGPAGLFQTLYDIAQRLHNMPYGWLILFAIAIIVSFPPLLGHTAINSICGFAFGARGCLIAIPAAVIGSAASFLLLRATFRRRVKAWAKQSKKWQAMEQVIVRIVSAAVMCDAKGLPLIVLIRLCPLPWVYSNAFFASIESVRLWQFVFATLCLSPKIFLAVFIGSQVADLSDGTHRKALSTGVKILDILSIAVSVGLALGTGWYVWSMTDAHIQNIEDLPRETGRLVTDVLDSVGTPLLHNFSSEPTDESVPLNQIVADLTTP